MSLLDSITGATNAALPLPWLATAGQPSAEQFAAARDAGVKVVIDLRDPMEPRNYDQAATLATLGLEYIVVPVVSGALNDAMMERVLTAVRAHAGTPVILHCASANIMLGCTNNCRHILDFGLQSLYVRATQFTDQIRMRTERFVRAAPAGILHNIKTW